MGGKRWRDHGYAAEELVAELGAAFLCADLAITPTPRADHASYIASWLEVPRNDQRAISSPPPRRPSALPITCISYSPEHRGRRLSSARVERRAGIL
jgi:antirestriction protein ArdC